MSRVKFKKQAEFWKKAAENAPDKDTRRSANALSLEAARRADHKGEWGVWAEPRGHTNNPSWLPVSPLTFEAADAEAKKMNIRNNQWHYTARPILPHS